MAPMAGMNCRSARRRGQGRAVRAAGSVLAAVVIASGLAGAQDEFHSSGDCQRRHQAQSRAIQDEHIARMRGCRGNSGCIRRTNAWKAEELKRIGAELRACVRQSESGPPDRQRPGEQPTPEGPPTPPEDVSPPPPTPPPSSPPTDPPESGPPEVRPPDGAPTPPTPPRQPRRRPAGGGAPPPLRIAVLGDSQAVSPRATFAFPRHLQLQLRRRGREAAVSSHSRWGATSADALASLDAALTGTPALLIVAVGSNDGLRGLPVADLRRNLTTIVRTARRRGVAVLLCEARTLDFEGVLANRPRGDYAASFNRVTADVARAEGATPGPFLLEGIIGDPALAIDDGVHPNEAGARRIAERLVPYVEAAAPAGPAGVPSGSRR
jgi:acyl-CoA thioesterase-1